VLVSPGLPDADPDDPSGETAQQGMAIWSKAADGKRVEHHVTLQLRRQGNTWRISRVNDLE
jgi:hypothetical protein